MELDDEANSARSDADMMPGMSPHDPLTYDPTQGEGTPEWQRSVRLQRELNERLKNNAQYRRN